LKWEKLRKSCKKRHRNWTMVSESFQFFLISSIYFSTFFIFILWKVLRGVKRELLNILQQCRTNECKQIQKDYDVGRLDENSIHYDKVQFNICFDIKFHLFWKVDSVYFTSFHRHDYSWRKKYAFHSNI
jgi:hypothetical protein